MLQVVSFQIIHVQQMGNTNYISRCIASRPIIRHFILIPQSACGYLKKYYMCCHINPALHICNKKKKNVSIYLKTNARGFGQQEAGQNGRSSCLKLVRESAGCLVHEL